MIETATAVVILLLMSNALIGPWLDPKQTGGDEIPILRQLWLPTYAAAGALAMLRLRELARYWAPAIMLFILVGWAFASTIWSIEPDTSLRRAIAVAATTLFGLYLAASYRGRDFAQLLGGCFLVLAVGSYIACLAFPAFGVHSDVNAGAWKGLWYEKNQMGAVMVYGALTGVAALVTSPRRAWLWLVLIGLCSGLVIMTTSKTSLLALLLVLAGGAGLWLMSRGPAMAVAVVWGGVTGGGLLAGIYVLAPEMLFEAVGKDPSLTGRTDIWAAVMRASEEAPVTGYGFAAFWGVDSAPAKWIRTQLEWPVPTAHNGWMDLLVQLGWTGVILFGVIFAIALIAMLFRHRAVNDGYWATLFLAVFAVEIMSESFIMAHNSLPWVLAVAAIARILGPASGGAPRTVRTSRPTVPQRPSGLQPA